MAKLLSAYGYQGDAMNLPVADVENELIFYSEKMGFSIVELQDTLVKKAILERDGVQFAIAENGGDPEQDGCAFHTDDVYALREEFLADGLTGLGKIDSKTREDGSKFKVFYVVAPDGLCYWFGERE